MKLARKWLPEELAPHPPPPFTQPALLPNCIVKGRPSHRMRISHRSLGEMYTDGSYHGKTAKHGSTCLLKKGEAVLSQCEKRPGIYPSELLAIVQGSDQSPMGHTLRVDSKTAIKAIQSTKCRVRCRQLVEEARQSILAKAQRLKHVKAHASPTGNNNVDALPNRRVIAPPPPPPEVTRATVPILLP